MKLVLVNDESEVLDEWDLSEWNVASGGNAIARSALMFEIAVEVTKENEKRNRN